MILLLTNEMKRNTFISRNKLNNKTIEGKSLTFKICDFKKFVWIINELLQKGQMYFTLDSIDKYKIKCVSIEDNQFNISVKNDTKRTHTVWEYEFNEFKSFDEANLKIELHNGQHIQFEKVV